MPCVLLTGATGYIGSHTWLALLEAGYDVVGIDNFCNSSPRVLERLADLAGRVPSFVEGDVRDAQSLDRAFALGRQRWGGVQAVVHFAALKAVGESTEKPLDYFGNNLGGLIATCQALQRHTPGGQPLRMVFSSSATVYGKPEKLPIREDAALSTTNPYGATKLMGEQILAELQRCDARWLVAALRYFNPVGAHPSGRIGEDPRGVPNNLMPYVAQVAIGQRERLNVFGRDYDTPDGTGVRDYIHICDLADGHVAALRYLFDKGRSLTVNLGTGRGHSVLEVVRAYEKASGREVPLHHAPRRPGDIDACYADPALAERELGWRARRDLEDMCLDSWRWQSQNPRGFSA